MKVLFISQGKTEADQVGYVKAFEAVADVVTVPWMGISQSQGWSALWKKVIQVNEDLSPDLIFFQRFHSDNPESPKDCIEVLRKSKNSPFIFADCGDMFQPYLGHLWVRKIPHALIELAKLSDIFFMSSIGAASRWLKKHGATRIELLPLAFSNYQFPHWRNPISLNPDFDVVMVGSLCVQKRRPISTLTHLRYRHDTANRLWKRYGKRFGLFGAGWKGHPAWQGEVDFKDQLNVYKNSKICVDARPPAVADYYASNRPFFIAGAGATMVQYYMPHIDEMFREGKDSHFVYSPRGLVNVCDTLIDRSRAELIRQGQETQQFIQQHHTTDKRVDTIISYVQHLREPSIPVRNWHFI